MLNKMKNRLQDKLWEYLTRNYKQVYTLKGDGRQVHLCKVLGTYQRDDDAFRAIANVTSGMKTESELLKEYTEKEKRKAAFVVISGED